MRQNSNNDTPGGHLLPFLNKKAAQTGLIVKNRAEMQPSDHKAEESDDSGLEACAAHLLKAIESKDTKSIAEALKYAFEILDSEEHVEGPHIEEEPK